MQDQYTSGCVEACINERAIASLCPEKPFVNRKLWSIMFSLRDTARIHENTIQCFMDEAGVDIQP